MKRIASLILTMALLMTICVWTQAEPVTPTSLYELSEGQDVLTVRLPANETTGYQWDFEISNPELLELITSEYTGDEAAEGMVGVGGIWAASFGNAITTEGMGGCVFLTLRYRRPSDSETVEPAAGYALEIWVSENGLLQVDGVWTLMPIAAGA